MWNKSSPALGRVEVGTWGTMETEAIQHVSKNIVTFILVRLQTHMQTDLICAVLWTEFEWIASKLLRFKIFHDCWPPRIRNVALSYIKNDLNIFFPLLNFNDFTLYELWSLDSMSFRLERYLFHVKMYEITSLGIFRVFRFCIRCF
jgi:hypothetical protein